MADGGRGIGRQQALEKYGLALQQRRNECSNHSGLRFVRFMILSNSIEPGTCQATEHVYMGHEMEVPCI